MPICVHRCTQLAHSTLDRPVFDLELEGVPEDWQGAWLGAPDNRLPDRVLERTTRSSRQGRYQPLGPRARMTRPEGSGGPAAAGSGPGGRGPHGGSGHGQRGVGRGRRGRGGRRHSLMILALLLKTLCLHAVACPCWLIRVCVVNYGGGGAATRLRSLVPYQTRPVPVTMGTAAVPPRRPPPPREAPGTGPPARQEGVYTPTAHEGAPGRGDGPGSPSGGGNPPRRWQGAPRRSGEVAVWHGAEPPRHYGSPSHRD